jgi:hypothetical protein
MPNVTYKSQVPKAGSSQKSSQANQAKPVAFAKLIHISLDSKLSHLHSNFPKYFSAGLHTIDFYKGTPIFKLLKAA